MPDNPIGTIFVELDLDPSRYTKAQQKLYKDATTTTLSIEENFKKLGIRSSAEFDLMRQKISNAYNMIANSSKATTNDILRAEQAKNDKLRQLADEQFGHQESLLSQLKEHWLGITAGVYAAYRAVQGVIREVSEDIQLYMKQEAAERGLKQAMISMKRYSDEAYDALLKQASALQRVTGIGDEMTISGQKMLMTFKQIPDELMGRTTRAMLDLAALMGGDVKQAALQLGKAAMGMTGELRRVGITIDEETFKMKGFEGVLQQIEEQVGGQAEAVAQGSGQWKILGAAISDAKESLGRFFSELMTDSGILKASIKLVEGFATVMNETATAEQRQRTHDLWELNKLNRALAETKTNLEVYKTAPAGGLLGEWMKSSSIQTATERIKDLEDRIASLTEKLSKTRKPFEQFAQDILDAMDPLKELKKTLEETSKVKPFVQSILSPEYQEERKKVFDELNKYTMSPYELEIKKLDEWYAQKKGILRDMSELDRLYFLKLDEIKKKYFEAPVRPMPGLPAFLQPKEPIISALTPGATLLPKLETHLEYMTAQNDKAMEVWVEKAESKWVDFSKQASDSFINAMVDGSDDWLDYLSREFKRTFLQETMGTQMKSLMSGIFGEKGFLQTTTLGGVSLGNLAGAGMMGYGMGGLGGGLGAAGGFMAGSAFLTGGAFAEGGALAGLGGPFGMILGAGFGAALNNILGGDEGPTHYEQLMEAWNENIKTGLKDAVGQGFLAGLESGEYQQFKDSFSMGIKEMIVMSFQSLAMQKGIEPLMGLFGEAFGLINKSNWAAEGKPNGLFENMIQQYIKENPITLEQITGAFPTEAELNTFFAEFEPYFEQLTNSLQGVMESLGLNTEATTQNTSAILGPVESYLNQLAKLDTGPTSLAWLENRRSELWQQAMMNPDQFQPYSSFMTSGYIEQMQKTGGFNIAGERTAIEGIPWVQEARGITIVNNIVINDEVVQQQVINSLDNPEVVKKVNSRVQPPKWLSSSVSGMFGR